MTIRLGLVGSRERGREGKGRVGWEEVSIVAICEIRVKSPAGQKKHSLRAFYAAQFGHLWHLGKLIRVAIWAGEPWTMHKRS